MKKNFWSRASFGAVLVALVGIMPTFADPVLPYSAPIADKLSNDIAALESLPDRTPAEEKQIRTDRSALEAYHKPASTLSDDISILKSLNQLLARNGGYPILLNAAAENYLTDFEAREAELRRIVSMSPSSTSRSNAYKQLRAVSNVLVKAEAATTTTRLLAQLGSAARKLSSASNAAARAASAKVKASSAFARVGRIGFSSSAGQANGTNANGVLDFHATDNGLIRRAIDIHIEEVSSNTPATYELGVGANTATYTVLDSQHKSHGTNFVLQFNGIPGPETNRSVLIIDAIKTNYVVGRFKFTGFTTGELNTVDTNRTVTITNGEFQITF